MNTLFIKAFPWLLLFSAHQGLAATYVIDASHTYPVFEIEHLGFSIQRGQFDETHGLVEIDLAAQTGRIEIQVQTASLDTGHALRDEVLKGASWFDSAQFPAMTYQSQRLVFKEAQLAAIEGELTLRGITRPLRLEIVRYKCGLNLAARKRGCGADASGVLKRSDFGMMTGLPFVGDEVRLRIQVEAYAE